ncbi:MAG TPA: hypothetical protein VK994_06410 [Bacteroidales bacterium]|nr:hypothetical protein [Bacteroidales bacterium]
MILIYCPQLSPRIRYVFKLLIKGLLKDEPAFTSNAEEFAAFEGPKINYSARTLDSGLFFPADGLLSEKEIESHEVKYFEEGDIPAIFPVYQKGAAMSFDPFAASFYMVTRYEEYLPYVRDEYGRFQARESLAWKHGFLDKPVVNMWAEMLAEKISQQWPQWKPGPRKYSFIPTIDVNSAWLYRQKGFFRTAAALGESIAAGNFSQFRERFQVVLGLKTDPFDTYSEQLGLHKDYELNTIYFILFADYNNNDRNISVNNRYFHILIKTLADYCRIGIHASYASLKAPDKLAVEFKRLAGVLNHDITITRQHFHVLNMPTTYRHFVNMDVENDFSMGYAVTPGFRAGICDPFFFYDLDYEMETNMKVWPYALVDKGLEYGYDMESSFLPIIERVKALKGTLVTLWNNESLVREGEAKVNLRTYEKMIKMALP